jgi:vitamin B12 transporter
VLAVSCVATAQDSSATVDQDSVAVLDKVVVTATRTETSLRAVGSAISVVTAEEMEIRQDDMVTDALRGVPGLALKQTAGPGSDASVFMRGANAGHTLVLLDGIELHDPITVGRTSHIGALTLDNVERVEVLRGPQSTLYGSDAVGGVVNLITKRPEGKPSFYVLGEGGSYRTFRGAAGSQGHIGWVDYSLGLSRMDTEGFSSAREEDGNTEPDGFEATTACARIGVTPLSTFGLNVLARATQSEVDLDNSGGAGGDDPNNTEELTQWAVRAQAHLDLFDARWQQQLGLSLTHYDMRNDNDPDAAHAGELVRSSYVGQMLKVQWMNTVRIGKANVVVAGIEAEQDQGRSTYRSDGMWGPYESNLPLKSDWDIAGYAQDQLRLWDAWFTTVGVRLDYSRADTLVPTFRVASAYVVDRIGTKVRASVGSGFRAPSIYQLYSEYGDTALEPEKSLGWDAGVDQTLFGDRIEVSAGYFGNTFDNLIDFSSSTFTYGNIAAATSHGAEVFATVRPVKGLQVHGNYTFTYATNDSTDKLLLQRPKHKIGGAVSYRLLDKATISVDAVHVGERFDYGVPSRVKLEPYNLVNVAVAYDVTENLRLYCRVDNVLDEDYEEVKGYGTAGISGKAGFRVSF